MEEKSYYDWLEVSPKASPEVIEKAYRALVLKYHPDVQQDGSTNTGEIIKKINEAHDVLSDASKRAEYDESLRIKIQQEQQSSNYTTQSQSELQNNNSYSVQDLELQRQQELEKQRQEELDRLEYERQVEAARQQAYHDAYIQDLRNRGYRIKYKKSFKEYLKIALVLIVLFIIVWLVWSIPFTRKMIIDFINSNEYSKMIFGLFLPLD